MEPELLLGRKLIRRAQGNINIHGVRWLTKWSNLPTEQATWEDVTFIQKVFPNFQPQGQVWSKLGELSGPKYVFSEEINTTSSI